LAPRRAGDRIPGTFRRLGAAAPTALRSARSAPPVTAPLAPDLCIIGAGAGGLAVAAAAAQMGAGVVLVERGKMGGDCLNFGCVPSKALLATARLAVLGRHSTGSGVEYAAPRIDFAAVTDGVHNVVERLAEHDSEERFAALGVTVLRREGRFLDRRTLRAGDTLIRPRRFVLATGSRPRIPAVPGLAEAPFLTNETVFDNRVCPDHLIVIGGGPIGIEMAQAHRRLGARVTVVDIGPILPRDDPELVSLLCRRLADEGVALRANSKIAAIEAGREGVALRLANDDRIEGSHLFVAAGRRPAIAALALDAAGIAAGTAGITVDARLRTTNHRAFAVGDVVGGPQYTHAAAYHAGIVIKNALFRWPARTDYRALPWTTYTDPELAQVGLGEGAAGTTHGRVRVLRWPFSENDRAQAERDTEGLVKIVARRDGRVLGASILGAGAGELILPWALAVSQKLRIDALANLVVPYPTRSEAGKRAAGTFYTPLLFSPRTRRLVRVLSRFG
jgi:pyruvate/2-oxoglutarate dehydrogenase complex dihydrolipoamide dehydrogenase (E3) component